MPTRARKFKDKAQAELYALRMASPPSTRLTGLGSAYFNGLSHPDKKDRYIRSSLAYAAWAAGVDTARRAGGK